MLIKSIIIGMAVGCVVLGFRYVLGESGKVREGIYERLGVAPFYWSLLWAFALVLAGLFLGWAAKSRPMIKGSGIPQVKGAVHDELVLDWLPELSLKLVCGVIGIGAGLSLGREGPCIQIGAYVGLGMLALLRCPHQERKTLVIAASAAGLSAAFSAPLSGVLFILEELLPSFSPVYLVCAMGASLAANAVASLCFGLAPVFGFPTVQTLPLALFPLVILLGIVCGLLGDVFKRFLYLFLDLYGKLRIPQVIRPVLPLLCSIPLGFVLLDTLGGGHDLIVSLGTIGGTIERSVKLLALILLVKLLFTTFCYGSGTAGGIFLPLLSLGALSGKLLGQLLVMAGFIHQGQDINFMILGMAGFFAAVVHAPLTGIALILEMSGSFIHLEWLVLVCLSAFVTSKLISSRPVYGVLLERILDARILDARRAPKGNVGIL
jgi:H+/Cl- antiporter ClcA